MTLYTKYFTTICWYTCPNVELQHNCPNTVSALFAKSVAKLGAECPQSLSRIHSTNTMHTLITWTLCHPTLYISYLDTIMSICEHLHAVSHVWSAGLYYSNARAHAMHMHVLTWLWYAISAPLLAGFHWPQQNIHVSKINLCGQNLWWDSTIEANLYSKVEPSP